MLDSHSLDPLNDAYFSNADMLRDKFPPDPEPVPALEELESIATKIMTSLSLGHDINRGRRLDGINNLTIDQLRALLAYLYWDDGSDDEEFILSVWKSDNAWTRDRVIETLVQVFGYLL